MTPTIAHHGYSRKRILGLLVMIALLAACGDDGRVEKELGGHHLSFVPPSGWQHYDHGKQQAFERDHARIVMKDLGLRLPPEEGGATPEEWLTYDLGRLDTATQRGVAARDSFTRDEHTFYVIDTWDRLTHEWRRRHLIVPNAGRHLAIYVEAGDWENTQDGFESLVESLEILKSPETAAPAEADSMGEELDGD